MLEVGVHHEYDVAEGVIVPGRNRGLMSEVPAEEQPAHTSVLGRQFADHFSGSVAAAVVHEHELECDGRLRAGRGDASVKGAQAFGLVAARNYNAQEEVAPRASAVRTLLSHALLSSLRGATEACE
jgi:hypothetical protein